MRVGFAISSATIFSYTWPRVYQPVLTSGCFGQASRQLRTANPPICLLSDLSRMPITYSLLTKQTAETSNAIIDHWSSSKEFLKLAETEGNLTMARDREDASKLELGIKFAQEKGVIDKDHIPEQYTEIDVLGKTPAEVADVIIHYVKTAHAASPDGDTKKGSVIVLCGLSGTGKVRQRCGSPIGVRLA